MRLLLAAAAALPSPGAVVIQHTPTLSVVWIDQWRVVVDWEAETVTIFRPRRDGGRLSRPLAEFDEFDGDFGQWIRSLDGNG